MKAKNIVHILTCASIVFLASCGSDELTEVYRMDKKYWSVKDYASIVHVIKFIPSSEKKPCYSVADKAAVFRKIVDKNNISVVIEDEELGLNHRSEFASAMFGEYRQLIDLYSGLDREDKLVYPMELADLLTFGLYLQLHYFDLGNRAIVQRSDDPKSKDVTETLRSNELILINNYCVYLGYVKREKSFTEEALDSYISGINEYFPLILEQFPDANFTVMRIKAEDMLKKTESEKVKTALNKVLVLLDKVRS